MSASEMTWAKLAEAIIGNRKCVRTIIVKVTLVNKNIFLLSMGSRKPESRKHGFVAVFFLICGRFEKKCHVRLKIGINVAKSGLFRPQKVCCRLQEFSSSSCTYSTLKQEMTLDQVRCVC